MMSESTAAFWLAPRDGGFSRWRPLTIGLLAGALLGTGLTLLAGGAPRAGAAPEARPAAAAREWPDRPLPREWRWERKAITFDHMFRERR